MVKAWLGWLAGGVVNGTSSAGFRLAQVRPSKEGFKAGRGHRWPPKGWVGQGACFTVRAAPLAWPLEAVLAGSGSIPADVACGQRSNGKCVLRSGGDAQELCKHP